MIKVILLGGAVLSLGACAGHMSGYSSASRGHGVAVGQADGQPYQLNEFVQTSSATGISSGDGYGREVRREVITYSVPAYATQLYATQALPNQPSPITAPQDRIGQASRVQPLQFSYDGLRGYESSYKPHFRKGLGRGAGREAEFRRYIR